MVPLSNENFLVSEDFETRKRIFVNTLRSEKGSYRITDTKSLNFFNANIEIILSILSINSYCVCNEETIASSNTIMHEFVTKSKIYLIESKPLKCTDVDIELITEIVKIILSVSSSFKRFFAPYITKLSKILLKMDSSCCKFAVLSNSFISLFKFYLDDVNFIDEVFVHKIMENIHLCEYHFFFIVLLKKQAFVKVLNGYNLIEVFFNMYDSGKTRIIKVITNLLEIYKQQDPVFQKTNFDIKKIVKDLTNREECLLELFMQSTDINTLNNVFNLICALLCIKTTHYFFISAFCKLIEDGKILQDEKDLNPKNIHTLYCIHILSLVLPFDISGLFFLLEYKNIIFTLGRLFFEEENLFHLHRDVFQIFQYILQLNPQNHFRLLNIVLSILEKQLSKWGREFFARENEKEWNMTSLNAFSLELYKELMLCRDRLSKEFKINNSERCKEIIQRMDEFMKSDEYLFVKWYYERNIRSENLNLENEKDVETYYEDCISDAHIRYLYYMVLEHLPSNSLFNE